MVGLDLCVTDSVGLDCPQKTKNNIVSYRNSILVHGKPTETQKYLDAYIVLCINLKVLSNKNSR